jgi:hypothetical protein
MATGVSADATATRTRRSDPADIVRIATDTDHSHVPGHHTGVPTTETAMSTDINRVATEIAAHLANVHLVEAAITMIETSVANRTPVQDPQAHQDRNLDRPTVPGEMIKAGIRGGARLLTSAAVADPKPTARHPRRRNEVAEQAEREKRLAAMQSNASELEGDRRTRLADLDARDAKQREEDDRKRSDKANFIGGIRKEAEGVDTGRRLQSGRGGRDED